MSNTFLPGDLSPFRTGFLKVALFISGAWVNLPTTELGDDGVTIIRGRRNGSSQGEPSSCSFRLKDPTGKYSPRHPASTYFGLIGRGTPCRVQVELVAGTVLDRWYGQVVSWTPKWDRRGSKYAYVEVEAAGVMRRLGQGSSPLRSPLYRACSTIGTNLAAYWPLEDGESVTAPTAAVGGRPLTVTGSPTFGGYTAFLGSGPMPTLESGRLVGSIPGYTVASPATGQVRWVGRIPSTTPNNAVLIRVRASGTLGWAEVRYSTGGALTVEGFNDSGVSVGSNTYALAVDGKRLRFSLDFTQSGANINWTIGTVEAGAAAGLFGTGTFTAVTLGRMTTVEVNPNQSALAGVAFGHLTVESVITSLFSVSAQVLAGFLGERADDRINRLCSENGLSFGLFTVTGAQLMGAQSRTDLLSLLRECEATDGGMLYEPKGTTDLGYRTGESLYSQSGANLVTVAYVDNMLQLEPVEDDDSTRNKVTVTRAGGAESTVTQTTGVLGTAGVGIYDEDVTLSLASDDRALQQAGWRVHLGTTDEQRWPLIGVDLADPRVLPALRNTFLNVGLGSRLEVTGLPPWLPPFTVSQIVQGYTERITPTSYRLEFVCSPARPYRVAYWTSGGPDRWSGDGTVTAATLAAGATSVAVTPPAPVTWTTTDLPFGILVNGEQMTVTAVTAVAGGNQTFTLIRAVNGVSKAHPAGSQVTLADPCYYGL